MNSSKPFYALLAILALTTLAGCDSIPFIDTGGDYKTTGRGKPLEIPPDLTAATTSDTYALPGGTTYSEFSQTQSEKVDQQEKLLPTPDNVRLERAGSQRWLVVEAPAEKIWPVVREFWTDLGFAVRVENAQTGVMETEWVDPSELTKDDKGNYLDKFQGWLDKMNSLNTRQKFRTRLDRGEEEGTTEIYMSHRSVTDSGGDGKTKIYTPVGRVDASETIYKENFAEDPKARAAAEDLDMELLRRLMVKLGVTEQQSRTVIANPVQERRAALEKDNAGNVTLTLTDPFDRAWRRVGLALDRIGFLVEDKDRSRGLFYVKYSDVDSADPAAKEKSLIDSLKFWGDDAPEQKAAPEPKKDDSLADKLKFWGDDKDKANADRQYRIKVERGGKGSQVYVTDRDGNRERSGTANRILNMLYEQVR